MVVLIENNTNKLHFYTKVNEKYVQDLHRIQHSATKNNTNVLKLYEFMNRLSYSYLQICVLKVASNILIW